MASPFVTRGTKTLTYKSQCSCGNHHCQLIVGFIYITSFYSNCSTGLRYAAVIKKIYHFPLRHIQITCTNLESIIHISFNFFYFLFRNIPPDPTWQRFCRCGGNSCCDNFTIRPYRK